MNLNKLNDLLSKIPKEPVVNKKYLKSTYRLTLKSFMRTEEYEAVLYFWEAEKLQKVACDNKGFYDNELIEIRDHYTDKLLMSFHGRYLKKIEKLMK